MTTRGYQPEGWIETFTGKKFVFTAPTDDMIDIRDIAHSLSMQCRYNGHCQRFYSVAEHSVLLSLKYMMGHPHSWRTGLSFLLHDAAEAYLSDLPRPIKYSGQMQSFIDMEATIDAAIIRKFDLLQPQEIIKEWDARICKDERQQNMSASGNVWGVDHLEPLGVTLRYWTPTAAKYMFLRTFQALHVSKEDHPNEQ